MAKMKVMADSDLTIYHSLMTGYVDDKFDQYSSLPRQISDLSASLQNEITRSTQKDTTQDAQLGLGVFIQTNDTESTDDIVYANPTVASAGLTCTNCTYVDGGVSQIGKMVVLNIRVEYTGTGTITVSGVPNPKNVNGNSYVPVTVQCPGLVTSAFIERTGGTSRVAITFANTPYAGTAIMLSATYITE